MKKIEQLLRAGGNVEAILPNAVFALSSLNQPYQPCLGATYQKKYR
jgi:hypothetical protein